MILNEMRFCEVPRNLSDSKAGEINYVIYDPKMKCEIEVGL